MLNNNESCIITYIRVFAMFLIVICHLQQAYDNKWAWVFNVGVQVFLAISGWLYGNKNIVNWGKWYKDKIMKLYVPYIIYVVSSYIFYVSVGENKLLCLKSVNWIFLYNTCLLFNLFPFLSK